MNGRRESDTSPETDVTGVIDAVSEIDAARGKIDLNCDMGESYGAFTIGDDAAMMRFISSANVACGLHAGDWTTMRRTVRLCLEVGVSIGAHPGLPDLQGFGRRTMAVAADEIYAMTLYQIGALQAIARAEGGEVKHVKPHGALYHMAESDESVADALARATAAAGERLVLVGASGGRLIAAGEAIGLAVRQEAFADRAYGDDGRLLPRSAPGAVLVDSARAAAQALRLVRDRTVVAASGRTIPVRAETICIHGDSPHAVSHAKAIYEALAGAGIEITHR